MSQVTVLGKAQITTSPHDTVTIELGEQDGRTLVKVSWPLSPSIIDPTQFPDTASMVVKLFAQAHTALAAIKTRRKL
jgi:hypothetical protein